MARTDLEGRIRELLGRSGPMKAFEIAHSLQVDRSEVSRLLHGPLRGRFQQDADYRWSAAVQVSPPSRPVALELHRAEPPAARVEMTRPIASTGFEFPGPVRLREACEQLARKFANVEAPADFDYDDLVERLHRGEELSGRDRSRLPWALGSGRPPLLQRSSLGRALRILSEQLQRGRARPLQGAVWCLTHLDAGRLEQADGLREWVCANLRHYGPRFKSLEHWFSHLRLFEPRGEEYLAETMLKHEPLEEGLSGMQLHPRSWIPMRAVEVLARTMAVERPRRLEFFHLLEKEYPDLIPGCVGIMLARIRQKEDWRRPIAEIETFFLKHLGHPSINRKGHWSVVPTGALEVARKWVTERSIRLFYDHLVRSGDKHRLHFWLRYLDMMDTARILVGPSDSQSANQEVRRAIREREIGRLFDVPSDVSAVLLQVGHWFIVEFSQVGNATYCYKTEHLKPDPWWRQSDFSVGDLRRGTHWPHRVVHPHRVGSEEEWSDKFAEALRRATEGDFPPRHRGTGR